MSLGIWWHRDNSNLWLRGFIIFGGCQNKFGVSKKLSSIVFRIQLFVVVVVVVVFAVFVVIAVAAAALFSSRESSVLLVEVLLKSTVVCLVETLFPTPRLDKPSVKICLTLAAGPKVDCPVMSHEDWNQFLQVCSNSRDAILGVTLSDYDRFQWMPRFLIVPGTAHIWPCYCQGSTAKVNIVVSFQDLMT